MTTYFAHLEAIVDYDKAKHPLYLCPHCGVASRQRHIATCKAKLADILARSADADNVEDEAMEESEEEHTRESESLVLSEDEATTLPILNI